MVAGPAVEERGPAARLAKAAPQGRSGARVVGRLSVGARRQDDAVVLLGRPRRDLPLHDIQHDERWLALERIAPSAAAGGLDAHEGARGDRLVVDEARQDALARLARVDRDAERLSRSPARKPPSRYERAGDHREEVAVAERAELLQVAEAASLPARAAGV